MSTDKNEFVMKKDLVCGMGVEEDDPQTFVMISGGQEYFFCSAECLALFSRDPLWYIIESSRPKATAVDPVCRMQVDKGNPPCTTQHKGVTYYFCSRLCKLEFDAEPMRFIQV